LLEKIKNQINEIEIILSGLKKLENIDKYLKENKYAKKITEKYFKSEDQIIEVIKSHAILVEELKKNHIKLTDNQKSQEKQHKQYIEELNKTLNSTLKILKKLSQEKTYIDEEIIDILALNNIEDLKDIIEFNKIILLKKQGYLKQQNEETTEIKEETKIEEQTKPKETQKITIKKIKKETKIEKILIYNNIEEINEFLKKQYNMQIKTERNIEELNEILEIIENSNLKGLKSETIKEILEKAEISRLKSILKTLQEKEIEPKEIENVENVFLYNRLEKQSAITQYILEHPAISKKEKLELLRKQESKKEKFIKNINALICYNLVIKNNNVLLTELSLEKIDQLIELGLYYDLKNVAKLYNQNEIIDNMQLEEYLTEKRYVNMPEYLFGGIVYNLIIEAKGKKHDVIKTKEIIYKKMENDSRYKAKLLFGQPNLDLLTSRNQILRAETETSKKSMDNFLITLFPCNAKDLNPIYRQKNKYLEAIDKKFLSETKIDYTFRLDKNIAQSGFIKISKSKVLRLLNQHVIDGDEITKEIVKQCMFYNLVITEEILNEIDRILTNELDLVDQKIKKY